MKIKIDFPRNLPTLFSSPLLPNHVTASANSVVPWQSQSGHWDDKVVREVSSYDKDGYTYRTAVYDGSSWGTAEFEMTSVTNAKGEYVGDPQFADYLIKNGIRAEKSAQDHNVCSVGFIPLSSKWAGWSHRALAMFGIGDMVFEADFGDGETLFTQHGSVKIENLDQARQAACNFAEYVS